MYDLSVKGASPVQKMTSQTGGLDQSAPEVGLGSIASNGAIPDTAGQVYEAVSQSLSKFFPTMSGDKVDILIAEAVLKRQELVGKTETHELVAKEEQKRQNAAEARHAAEESQKNIDEAKRASKKSGIFSKIGAILSAVAGVVTMAVGAALIITGAGAPVGVALMAIGGVSVFSAVDQIIQQDTGAGMFGHLTIEIMMANGASKEEAEKKAAKVDMGINIGLAVTAIIISVATLRLDSAATGSMIVAQHVATGATAIVSVGTAGVQTGAAVISHDAAKHRALGQEQQADAADLRALNEQLNDFIDQILARVSGTKSQFNAMLEDVVASVKDRGDTLSRAKFTG